MSKKLSEENSDRRNHPKSGTEDVSEMCLATGRSSGRQTEDGEGAEQLLRRGALQGDTHTREGSREEACPGTAGSSSSPQRHAPRLQKCTGPARSTEQGRTGHSVRSTGQKSDEEQKSIDSHTGDRHQTHSRLLCGNRAAQGERAPYSHPERRKLQREARPLPFIREGRKPPPARQRGAEQQRRAAPAGALQGVCGRSLERGEHTSS